MNAPDLNKGLIRCLQANSARNPESYIVSPVSNQIQPVINVEGYDLLANLELHEETAVPFDAANSLYAPSWDVNTWRYVHSIGIDVTTPGAVSSTVCPSIFYYNGLKHIPLELPFNGSVHLDILGYQCGHIFNMIFPPMITPCFHNLIASANCEVTFTALYKNLNDQT